MVTRPDHVVSDDSKQGTELTVELRADTLEDGGNLVISEVGWQALDRLDEVKGLNAAI